MNSVGRYLVSILSADLQNTKVTPNLCSENTRHSVIGGIRNHCLFWGGVRFLYNVEYRNVETLRNMFNYAFDTVPDVARYINPLNAELNPIRHLLALIGARHIVHVSRIRVDLQRSD